MTRSACISIAFVACILVAAPTAGVFAQGVTDVVQLSGKVTKINGGTVFFTAPQGDYLLQAGPQNKTAVLTGILDASTLCEGVSVRFDAVLDDKNMVKGEVQELTVFTPSKSFGYGISLPKTESGRRTIAGKISDLGDGGQIVLTVPGEEKVQFQPASDAVVQLQTNLGEKLMLKLLRSGDTILVTGTGTAPKGKVAGRVTPASVFVRREAEKKD